MNSTMLIADIGLLYKYLFIVSPTMNFPASVSNSICEEKEPLSISASDIFFDISATATPVSADRR